VELLKSLPLVSVVINFYNEAKNVDMAPLALSKQTYRNFEVILIDDGSTDRTAELILEKYGSMLPCIKLIRIEKPRGLRPARNLGVKNAKGDIIITLDLHTTFDQRFIERIVTIFDEDKKVGAIGSVILPYGDKWFNCGMCAVEKLLFKIREKVQRYNYVYGTAAAYDAKALAKIGYLSTGKIVEDTDASWKLVENGWKILVAEDNLVFHKGSARSFKGFLKKLFVGGVRAAFLLSKYKTKLFYPQNLARILFPFFIILSLIYPFASLFLAIVYCLGFTFAFVIISKEAISSSLLGMISSLLLIFVSSLGLYYGLIAIIAGKKLHVD